MQDQTIPDPAEEFHKTEQDILLLLLDPEFHGPWTVYELGRELGDQIAAEDAVRTLHEGGLAHCCGEFVFASRAAARCHQLTQ